MLVFILILPGFIETFAAPDAPEFGLSVRWTGVDEKRTGILQHTLDASARVLEMTPTVNANYANESTSVASNTFPYEVSMVIVFSLPTGVSAKAEEIKLRVPIYIFESRDAADGKRAVSVSLADSSGKHAITEENHSTGLRLVETDYENNEYVLTNWGNLTPTQTIVLNVSYRFIPDKIKNGFINENIFVKASFNPEGVELAANEKSSDPLTVKLNTQVAPPFRFTVGQYKPGDDLTKYESWQSAWGGAPAGSNFTAADVGKICLEGNPNLEGFGENARFVSADDIGKSKYYYLIWEVRYQYRPNSSTQPYEVDIDIELEPDSPGEIMGITGTNTLSTDFNYSPNCTATFLAMTNSNASIDSGKTSANVNLTITPTAMNIRSYYPYNIHRWVLVRYPRGVGPGYGYNIETKLNATLTLTGIDALDDTNEGKDSAPEDRATWKTGELGNTGTKPANLTYTTTGTAGRGRYIGDPKYTHVESGTADPYTYEPIVYSIGGLGYRTLGYDVSSYANNTLVTLYSALNRLSEGSVANPVSVPILRKAGEDYTFRMRIEAEGYSLTKADTLIPNIDPIDPRNYYNKDYTVEVIDGLKFLRDYPLTKEDYSITSTYLTYTEYIDTINPNNGRLAALTSTNFDGTKPTTDYDRAYEPVEIWYKTIFTNEWAKAGEVKKTATTNTGVNDLTYGANGTYVFTTTDGSQLKNPGSNIMNAANPLVLPRGTYELKYVHTNSRFRVDITPYTTVALNSTNRVRAILDGGAIDAVTVGGTSYPAFTISGSINSTPFRSIHTMAVKDYTGAVKNFVDTTTAYLTSWPGATGITNPNNATPAYYQNALHNRSKELYPETAVGKTVMTNYRYITLDRTTATTTMEKISTGAIKNGYISSNDIMDDGKNSLMSAYQSVAVYEQISYTPDLIPGDTREEKLADLADNKIFNIITEGTFYDLLPPGTYIDGEVEAFTFYRDPPISASNANYRADAAAATAANRIPAHIEYYTVDNWQGSGRTMLIANVKAPEGRLNYQLFSAPANTTYTGPNGETQTALDGNAATAYPNRRIVPNVSGYEQIYSGFVINYKLETTYANIFDRSTISGDFHAYNAAAFRNRTPGILGIGPTSKLLSSGGTVPTSGSWSYNAGGALNAQGDGASTAAPQTRSFFTHLEVEAGPGMPADDNRGDTVYVISDTTFHIPTAYVFGAKKLVKSQSDSDFVLEAQTIPGGLYQYQFHFLAGAINLYTNIKFFDVLDSDAGSKWKGKLISVDTSFAESVGAAPVVYYSTVSADELKILGDPNHEGLKQLHEIYGDLTNGAVWQILPASKEDIALIADTITAIAVDLSKGKGGGAFQRRKNESVYVVVNMLAPTDPDDYEEIIENNLLATNQLFYSTTEVNPDYQDLSFTTAQESLPTLVSMRNISFGLGKSSFPASGDSSAPQAVDRDPDSGANTIEYTLSANNLDILPASNVTIVDTLPDGVAVDLADIKYYAGTDASRAAALPSTITVEQDGRKLTFTIGEVYAKQTINLVIPVTVKPDTPFGTPLTNSARITSINGAEYEIFSGTSLVNIQDPDGNEGELISTVIGSEEDGTTYHKVLPRVTLSGSKELVGRHVRANEFVFVLTDDVDNVISEVKNDKDGNFTFPSLDFPLPDGGSDTYTYYIKELLGGAEYPDTEFLGTVPLRNLPSGAPGKIEYDARAYKVTIEIAEAVAGKITATTTVTVEDESAEDITFTNTYLPDPVYLPFELNKILTGRTMIADEFSFAVTDTSGNTITVYDTSKQEITGGLTNSADGLTEFMLKFDAPGTYTYKVREIIPDDGNKLENVEYDDSVYTVEIEVVQASVDPNSIPTPVNSAQRKDGQLSFDALPKITKGSDDARLSFTNVFTPTPVSATITGTKILEGGRTLKTGEFNFELWDITDPLNPKVVQTAVTHDADGKIEFEPITYTAEDAGAYGKVFNYEVREVKPAESPDPNITYAAPVPVRVNVTINRDAGVLNSAITIGGGSGFVITNKYTADALPISVNATKILGGGGLTDGQFRFTLTDVTNDDSDYHAPVQTNVESLADGTIPFAPLQISAPSPVGKPYKYMVTEVKGTDGEIDYDPAVFYFAVTVVQNPATGVLSPADSENPIVVTGGGAIEFNNFRKYDVTFELNYGSSSVHAEKTTNYDTSLGNSVSYDEPLGVDKMPESPSRPGWTFKGWNTQPDGEGSAFDSATTVTEDITVYAIWEAIEYTVIYDPNVHGTWEVTGAGYTTAGLIYGDEMPAPPAPGTNPELCEAHWIFTGWNTEQDGTGDTFVYSDDMQITENLKLYAQWVSEATYTVKYAPGAQGTWLVDDAGYTTDGLYIGTATPQAPAALPCNPGWTFKEWFTAVSATVTGNAEYVALWELEEYTVSFDGNGGTPGTSNVPGLHYKETLDTNMPGAPTKEGYLFKGWYTEIDGGTEFTKDTEITADITVYAKWESAPATVTYLPGTQGTWGNTDYIFRTHYDESTPAPPSTPCTPGYTFAGWNPTWSDTVTGDATYTALWTQDEYTVIYDPGEYGNWNVNDYTYICNYDDSMPAPPDDYEAADYAYYFVGWDRSFDPNAKVTGSITYTALWTEKDRFVIVYDPGLYDGLKPVVFGDSDDDDVYYEGDPTPEYPDEALLVRPGYIFDGWETDWAAVLDSANGEQLESDGPYRIEYTAKWTAIKYTVIYEPGEYGAWAPADYTTTDLIYDSITPAMPDNYDVSTQAGYAFAEWSPVRSAVVTDDVTYVATWKKIVFTVTYDSNYDEAEAPRRDPVFYGDAPGTVSPPTRPGYTFAGWCTTQDGTAADFDDSKEIFGNIEVYALWTLDEYTVTYAPGEQGTWNSDDNDYKTAGLHYGDTTPPVPTVLPCNQGYKFAGWSPLRSDDVTESVTYVAQWTPVEPPSDEGYIPPPPTPDKNEDPTESDAPTDSDEPADPLDLPPEQPPLPFNVILPAGTTVSNFPNIDFNAKQPNQTQPGGTVREAPPVTNSPERRLIPQNAEDGTVFFIETFENVPLGKWYWDEVAEEWVFEEFPPPLGNIPQTGDSTVPTQYMFIILGICLCGLSSALQARKKLRKFGSSK